MGNRRGKRLPCARHSQFHPTPVDPLQDTVEPITQSVGISGKMCLGDGKKPVVWQFRERTEKKKWERNNRADTKVKEKGREAGVPDARAETPLQVVEKTMLEQISTPDWRR